MLNMNISEESNRFELDLEVEEAVSSNNNDTDNSLNLHLEEQQQEEEGANANARSIARPPPPTPPSHNHDCVPEPEKQVQVPTPIATSLRPGTQPPKTKNSGRNNKSYALLVVFVIVLGVIIGTSTSTTTRSLKNDPTSAPPADAPTVKCNGEHLDEVMVVEEGNDDNAAPEGIRRLIAGTDTEYLSIGCFRTQDSPDKRPLMDVTPQEKVDECNSSCRTNYFGIVDSMCYCHSDPPQYRLSIGSCQFTENPCVEDDQK